MRLFTLLNPAASLGKRSGGKVKVCVLLTHGEKLRQRLPVATSQVPRRTSRSLWRPPHLPVPVEQVLGEAAENGKEAMATSPGLPRTDPLGSPSVHGNLDRVNERRVVGQGLLGETVNFFYPQRGDCLFPF